MSNIDDYLEELFIEQMKDEEITSEEAAEALENEKCWQKWEC